MGTSEDGVGAGGGAWTVWAMPGSTAPTTSSVWPGCGSVGLGAMCSGAGVGRGAGLGAAIDASGEEAVDEADDLGEVGFADGGADLGGEAGEGVGVGGVVAADGGGEVLVAEMEDGVADLFGFLGDAGADAGAAERDFAAAGGEDLVRVAMEREAEEFAVFGVGAEDGGDGVVGADLFEADLHAGDVAGVDLGAVLELGHVGFGEARMRRNCGSRPSGRRRRRAWRRAGGRGRRRR